MYTLEPSNKQKQDLEISGKGAVFLLQGRHSGKSTLRRCWKFMADGVLQGEDWFPKLGCAEWPDRGGPFLATARTHPPLHQHKAGRKHSLGEAASWGSFSHYKPGGQAGCRKQESMGSGREHRKGPSSFCSDLQRPTRLSKVRTPLFGHQSLWMKPLNAERE